MAELIINVALFIAGAIIENESSGKVTQIIMYNDTNNTMIMECEKNGGQ